MEQKKQEELAKFFKTIFDGTTGCIDIRTFIHTRKGDKIETKQRDHFFIKVKELKDLIRIISKDNFTKDRNIHFGVAPRVVSVNKKQTGSENDVKFLNCIFSDVDCKRESNPDLPTKEETLPRIEKFELPPSIIVDSGLGYQCYWLLKIPIPIKNRKMLLEVKGILKGLAQKLGGDVAAQDISHCLRVPGTLNIKPECPHGLPVRIIKFKPDLKYGPEFKKFMVKIEDLPGVDIDIKDVPIPPRFKKLLKSNKKLQNTYLTRNRPDISDQTGSGYDMALAYILIKNGFSDSEIAAIIRSSKTGTEKKITKGYLAITIKKAKAFFKEKRVKGIPGIREEYFRATDLKNSENFSIKYKGHLIYCQPWNNWLIYNEGKWEIESKRETQELAKRVILDYYKEASEMLDDRTRQNLIKEALKCESQRAIRAMIELANSAMSAVPDEFDQNPYIFNLENRTLDLNTLEFREHRPEDMLTKIANVNYNPEAGCPKWLAFLDKIFEGNEDLINYLQASLGYSLTGDIGEQCLFILYGPTGWNGKSTFISTIQEILGDYAISTPFETFLTRRGEHIPNDIARMRGARFVTAIEPGEGKRFNEELLKRLTGRDKVTARFLRQEYFDFYPECKIWLATNHKPTVREFSPSFWGRIRLIPFKLTIPEEERILHYEETLLEEKEGIFNWILEGYKKWKEKKLITPDEIKEATAEYKSSMDVVAEFIEGCCVENHREKITTKEIYKAYKNWCEVSGEDPVNKKSFGRRLSERGYKSIKIGSPKQERGWLGIALKDEDADLPFNND